MTDASAPDAPGGAVPAARMALAFASLGNAFVATYLHLWKLGLMGPLACASGAQCEYVQGSRYGWFLGVDVALIGAVGWALVFAVALAGTAPRLADDRRATALLALLVGGAFLFTLRLKYAEYLVLRAFCAWCAVNLVVVLLSVVLVWLDARRVRVSGPARRAAADAAVSTTA